MTPKRDPSATLDTLPPDRVRPHTPHRATRLVLLWSSTEPQLVGRTLDGPRGDEEVVVGRGLGDRGAARRALLGCVPPAQGETLVAIENPHVSREQLVARVHADGFALENVGRRRLLVDGEPVTRAIVAPGETVEFDGHLVFMCVDAAPAGSTRERAHAFGAADDDGIVGESAAAWALRDRVRALAALDEHVLLLGPSGTGKELVAQAIHRRSKRGARRLVARNAATLPSGLIDAELFGTAANYPNAGTPERPGLFGQADGSTLFLDEIGELSEELQAHLLRVLDERGEYQRLGDARPRRADVRLIAATNRPLASLKHDVVARFRVRVETPPLADRLEDLPLLVRHTVRALAAKGPHPAGRLLVAEGPARGEPRMTLELIQALLEHPFHTNVRELDSLIWTSVLTSAGDALELTRDVQAALASGRRTTRPGAASHRPAPPAADDPREVTPEQIREALARADGVRDKAWRDLGLSSRYALKRLMQKYGIR